MRNSLKAKLKSGHACVNGWSMLPSIFAVEFFAQAGWDSVTIDMQHGLHDYASASSCIQAMQSYSVAPLVRVPWNEPGIIGKVLDGGACGIICPMINTRAEALTLIKASHYPPLGQRSYGPIRSAPYGEAAAYLDSANQEILVLPQIETQQAVDNLEAILDVEGVSGVYVGPGDLGLSLGLAPTFDREEPSILAIYRRLIAETSRRGLVAGIHNATPAYAIRMIDMGFRFVTVASDVSILTRGARDALASTRQSNPIAPNE